MNQAELNTSWHVSLGVGILFHTVTSTTNANLDWTRGKFISNFDREHDECTELFCFATNISRLYFVSRPKFSNEQLVKVAAFFLSLSLLYRSEAGTTLPAGISNNAIHKSPKYPPHRCLWTYFFEGYIYSTSAATSGTLDLLTVQIVLFGTKFIHEDVWLQADYQLGYPI